MQLNDKHYNYELFICVHAISIKISPDIENISMMIKICNGKTL